jgi:IS5 family transposase
MKRPILHLKQSREPRASTTRGVALPSAAATNERLRRARARKADSTDRQQLEQALGEGLRALDEETSG